MSWLKSLWQGPQSGTKRISLQGETHFTPHAQQVLALARKEADRLNHKFLGTEHLLLGIVALGQGTAVTVLRKLGLQLNAVRLEIEKQVGTGPEQKPSDDIPYKPRVKNVLALAAKEAKALNHTLVGTEHILLGLLVEGEGVAARVLKRFGLDIEKTRQAILTPLDPKPAPAAAVTPSASLPKPRDEVVDTHKLYDVYCAERNQEVVVYRNAIIKGTKCLPKGGEDDAPFEFLEIQQADGKTVFVSKSSVIKFCERGVTPRSEKVPGGQA